MEGTKKIMNYMLARANNKLKKCYEALMEVEGKWDNALDLKLHDVTDTIVSDTLHGKLTLELNDEDFIELFNQFCESQYEFFNEACWETLKEYNNFADIAEYIGRTSKFYITDLHDRKNSCSYLLYKFLENVTEIELLSEYSIDVEKTMEWYEGDTEKLSLDLLYIIDGLENTVNDFIHDINFVYDYVKEAKDKQVENFAEFVLANAL